MATKWISTLTGTEMDSALTDMAYHNSEAYAVGTRNGVPVGSSDVTYHNNSKYWAEQVYGYTDRAEDAANRAEAAVPSGTAGAVFFDRAQTLTSAEQAQARANIMAGGSNRNLLDNPWFTVNQRSATTISANNSYIADRWLCSGNGWSATNDGTNVTMQLSSGVAYLFQKLPSDVYDFLDGKTVTYSILVDGEISAATFVWDKTKRNTNVLFPDQTILQFWYGDQGQPCLRFTVVNTYVVSAIKLELGSVSTLANDSPPDYGTELAKCQRYFARISVANASVKTPIAFGFENAPTQCRFKLTTPVPLRATPTPSASGTFYLDGSSGEHQVTSFASAAAVYLTTDGIIWAANSSGLTAGAYILNSINGGYIDLSADL